MAGVKLRQSKIRADTFAGGQTQPAEGAAVQVISVRPAILINR
jgi:hypothetical protein